MLEEDDEELSFWLEELELVEEDCDVLEPDVDQPLDCWDEEEELELVC